MNAPIPAKFWAEILEDVTDIGCWLWTGCIIGDTKYTRVRTRDGREIEPHYYAWELTREARPDKLYSACPCVGCVNPDHWIDEATEIVEDDPEKYRPPRRSRRKTHCKRGHAMEGANIEERGGRRWCRACRKLGVQNARANLAKTERRPKPDRDTLANELAEVSIREVGRRYGVTEGAVRRWKRGYGL